MASPLRLVAPGSPAPGSAPATARPQFAVIPGRRRVAWFAVALTVVVGALMIGAVLLHTAIAERQLEIDRLENSVRASQADFDELRAERAELRSPTRLATRAAELGLVPSAESDFVPVDPMVLAVTIARTGQMPVNDENFIGSTARLEPLDQFRLVKSVGAEQP